MTTFRDATHADQLASRARRPPHVRETGDHILPRRASTENLWPGLRARGVRPMSTSSISKHGRISMTETSEASLQPVEQN